MAPWRRASSSSAAAVVSSEPVRPLAGGNARVSPEISSAEEEGDEGRWSTLLPELLSDILRRVHAGAGARWPRLACACLPPVARGIRRPRAAAVRRRRDYLPLVAEAGTHYSVIIRFMDFGFAALTDEGKFLLAARRIRCGLRMEYVISIHSDDLSLRNHVGKLKSDLMRTKFTIYDQQPRCEGAKASKCRYGRWSASKQISPRNSTGDVEIGEVSYEYNLLKSRGPRKIQCSIQCPIHEAGIDPKEAMQPCPLSLFVLTNKTPRWHEHLQCWCLNFHGRVMVASVKNFQLISPMQPGVSWGDQDDEMVILQFGKIEDDVFTMDYRQPLSAFQAFAICLTSFGSKFALE
ncbi:hypothetical protein PR202_ga09592 [Eleusine coracana subsp. coracana]|uniref:Tubby C-terminal domain-containing protein n=1 Tax=Eleusine coracana subsp. coracana TaxID=191504 RepID=A0AAV5C563_ELECO|nr:hypothetical protein PR202_ga09592 [Eleusine coracana subsp. coracana]